MGRKQEEVVRMRLRVGLAVGFAAGYVLGAKAGRQRYEQIEQMTRKVWGSPPAEKLRTEIGQKLPEAVTAAAHKVGEIRHHKNGDDNMMRAGQLPA
jgi:hypothetical protein